MVCNPKEPKKNHIMLDLATPSSIIPSDSYPIERKSKTRFRINPIDAYIHNKPTTIQSWIRYIQQQNNSNRGYIRFYSISHNKQT